MNPSLSLTRSLFFYFKKCICMFLNKNCVYLRCTIWRFDTHGEIVTTVKLIILSCPHIIIVFLCDAAASAAKLLQSCPTLCDPMDGSPPGSPIPGILQARTLEWVAISFSNAWKWKVKVKSLSRVRRYDTWAAVNKIINNQKMQTHRRPSGEEWTAELWSVHTMEYCCLVAQSCPTSQPHGL